MKKSIKLLSLILSFAMLLSIIAGVDRSAYALANSGSCGDNVTYSFDSTTGTLTISGTGDMYDYSYDELRFSYSDSIKNVVVNNGVTSIGKYAFLECSGLISVTISNSVTSIGESAFEYCTSLTSVTIGNSVASIGFMAFCGCESLTNITIPNSVISIGEGAFEDCTSLTSITIPDSVTSMGDWVFGGCSKLTSVTIPYSLTGIGAGAFAHCTSLTGITIPHSVTSIGYDAFEYCTSLTSITIPNSVTNIGNRAFSDCRSLTSVTILNENCNIGTNSINATIYGFAGSTAEEYAKTNNNTFLTIQCQDYDLSHLFDENIIKNATCTENGIKENICSRCDYNYTEILPALGGEHNYEGSTIIEPTCTEKGTTRYTCSICEDYYDLVDIETLNHIYTSQVIIPPTCTENGSKKNFCTRCGDNYTEALSALGGEHNYTGSIFIEPTCTEKGTTRYTCSRCGDYYDLVDVDALGHNYSSEILNEPTCEDEGMIRYTCTSCGYYYDESIEALGHDTKIVESEEPSLVSDGYQVIECRRDGCDYYNFKTIPQLVLDYNKKIQSNGTETYKIEMPESGYLIFDFAGESEEWVINIYDEDGIKVNNLSPEFKEFFKKSYLQASIGSTVPNKNQIVALLSGTYYIEIVRLDNKNNDYYSGDYELSINYVSCYETLKETKYDLYNDAPTAKEIELNETYYGFLGSKYAEESSSGKVYEMVDERDAYRFEIPKGSGWAQLNVTLSSKAFAPLESDCTIAIYNAEFELCEDFKPLSISSNETKNEIAYLYEGVYYFAVINKKPNVEGTIQGPIEYSFDAAFKPSGTYICTEHKAKLVEAKNPTCLEDGYFSYVCQICNTEFKEIISATGHSPVIDKAINPTCNTTGLTEGSHCSTCGSIIAEQKIINKAAHNYKTNSIKKATISSDGYIVQGCTVCGAKSKSTIYYPKTISLSTTSYTYDGKVKKPSVKVVGSNGKAISSSNYTVSYASGRKNVGKYAVKITFKGNYSGTKTLYFTIKPKSTSISSVSAKSK
ncbi:MAG: leucine-rich repeat domain-containing protein, partial [Eubacterium sp.]